MRTLVTLLALGCSADPPVEDPTEPGACAELARPLRTGERTRWGVLPNQLRVILAGAPDGTWEDADGTTDVALELSWPGGLVVQIQAEPLETPPTPSPLWCADRAELPAELELAAADGRLDVDGEPVRVPGVVRAAGGINDLDLAFVGEVGGDALPGLAPEGAAQRVVVWATWSPAEGGLVGGGQVRLRAADGDPLDVGEPVAQWE